MDSTKIKEVVKERYSRLVGTGGGCCGEVSTADRKMAELGYNSGEIGAIPDNAVGQSFGCGNPNAFLHVKEGEVVLDLGSGAGFDAIIAARKVGPKGAVIGVDMTEAMLEAARENARKAGLLNVEFRKGDIEELPVDSGSVDHIISNCVINLAPDKEKVYREAYRVLKQGGDIVVSDIVTDNFPEELRRDLGLWASCAAGALEEKDYLDAIRRAGFRDVEVLGRAYFTKSQVVAMACGCSGGGPGQQPEGDISRILDENLKELADDDIIGTAYSIKIRAVK